MSENFEDIRLIDAEAQGDRLVTFLDEQHFNDLDVNEFRDLLATLDGIEFGQITFDDNEVFGASFLNNEQNHDKIEAAGYSLMISDYVNQSQILQMISEYLKEKGIEVTEIKDGKLYFNSSMEAYNALEREFASKK